MKVKDLISRLNKLVEENPENADAEVRWYDGYSGRLCRGDGWPVQLFRNIYNKELSCVLNAVQYPPAYGMKAVSDKHSAAV